MEKEYERYGEEWIKEMKKFNKNQLVNMLRIELMKSRPQYCKHVFITSSASAIGRCCICGTEKITTVNCTNN